jgi:hypothetical protein
MQIGYWIAGAVLVGCGAPIPRDQAPTIMCPVEAPVGCSGTADLPSCLPMQTLDSWVEQMDSGENGNTGQPI